METAKNQLMDVAGVHPEEIMLLIHHLGPTAMESVRSSSAAPETRAGAANGIPSSPLARIAPQSMDRRDHVSDSEADDGNAMEVSPDRNALSSADRLKLDYIKEVHHTLQHPEAVGLAKGFISGQLSFGEVIQHIPAAYIRAPHLIERFACLTNHPSQRQILSRLSIAVGQLAACIFTIPGPLRRQVCQEISALVAHHIFPTNTSATREYTFFACQRAMPAGVVLPALHGPPQLHYDDSSASRIDSMASRGGRGAAATVYAATAASVANAAGFANVGAPHSTGPASVLVGPSSVPSSSSPSSFVSHVTAAAASTQSTGYGPSYTRRPSSYDPPLCSARDALGDSVLNDYFHCAGSGSEGSSQDNIRNPHQEALFRLEEDALCVDILVGRAQSCVRVLAEIGRRLELLSQNKFVIMVNANGERIHVTTPTEVINSSLLAIHIDTFRVIAKNRTSMVIADPITHFYADPQKFIVEMTRLCMFQADEHVRIRRCFGKLWKQVFAHQYIQSLDHRVYRVKNDDKPMMSPKALLSHLNLQYHEALVCGRQDSLDFQQLLDFNHFRYNLLPHITHSKSQRYQLEHPHSSSSDHTTMMDTEPSAPEPDSIISSSSSHPLPHPNNFISHELRAEIESHCLDLLEAGGTKILSPADNHDTANWMRDTFSFLFSFPSASQWSGTDSNSSHLTQKILFGPLQLYVILRMYHTLHERIRLAYWLSQNFESSCWQFSDTPPPMAPSSFASPSTRFPQFTTYEAEKAPVEAAFIFGDNPPTPFIELSAQYLDTHPEYIAQWESESAPIARLTRAGAISSAGLLLGGAPPQPNTQLHHAILRQAAQLRNTPLATSTRPTYAANTVPAPDSITDVDAIASLPPLKDDTLGTPMSERFPAFLTLLTSVLKGSVEAGSYELHILKLLGPEAYPLYSLPRLITNMITQIRLMMTLPGRQPWWQLWSEHMQSMLLHPPHDVASHRAAASRYLSQAESISHDHKFVEFRISALGNITYKVHQRIRPQVSEAHVRLSHEVYIKSWNSPKLDGVSISERNIFLTRNVSIQLPEDVRSEPLVGRAPSWDLAQAYHKATDTTLSSPAVHVSLDPSTYKMTIEAFSTDWMMRKSRLSRAKQLHEQRTEPRSHNPASPLHQIATQLFERAHKQTETRTSPSQSTEVQDHLRKVAEIVKAELDRPDLVVVEAAPIETVSSRLHRRKTKVPHGKGAEPNGESDGEDAENVENVENVENGESGSEEASPEVASEEGSSSPDVTPYQMQVD